MQLFIQNLFRIIYIKFKYKLNHNFTKHKTKKSEDNTHIKLITIQ